MSVSLLQRIGRVFGFGTDAPERSPGGEEAPTVKQELSDFFEEEVVSGLWFHEMAIRTGASNPKASAALSLLGAFLFNRSCNRQS